MVSFRMCTLIDVSWNDYLTRKRLMALSFGMALAVDAHLVLQEIHRDS